MWVQNGGVAFGSEYCLFALDSVSEVLRGAGHRLPPPRLMSLPSLGKQRKWSRPRNGLRSIQPPRMRRSPVGFNAFWHQPNGFTTKQSGLIMESSSLKAGHKRSTTIKWASAVAQRTQDVVAVSIAEQSSSRLFGISPQPGQNYAVCGGRPSKPCRCYSLPSCCSS